MLMKNDISDLILDKIWIFWSVCIQSSHKGDTIQHQLQSMMVFYSVCKTCHQRQKKAAVVLVWQPLFCYCLVALPSIWQDFFAPLRFQERYESHGHVLKWYQIRMSKLGHKLSKYNASNIINNQKLLIIKVVLPMQFFNENKKLRRI